MPFALMMENRRSSWSIGRPWNFVRRREKRFLIATVLATALLEIAGSIAAAPLDEPPGKIDPPTLLPRQKSAAANLEPGSFGFFNIQQEWEMEHMLPDRWLQPLTNRGIDYVMVYSTEVQGNVRGGLSQGAVIAGVLEAGMAFDAEKLLGWPGATFYASSLVSHGPSLSARHVGDLYAGSSLESEASIRLYEMWLEQRFMDETISLRAGQLALDREFLGTDLGTLFMSAAFGWPAVFGLSIDAPTHPVAAPGVRLRINLSHCWLQTGIFTGRPEPLDENGEPLNGHGIYFNLDNSALVIGEAGFSTATDEEDSRYPGVYKLGGWLHTGWFEDQYYDDVGLSLADPFSSQNPRRLKNDWGLYGVAEQKIWRPSGAVEERGLSVFARVGGVPSDRNLVSLGVDGGLHYVGPLPGRPHDVTGLALSYTRIGARTRAIVGAENLYSIPAAPLPDYETVAEVTCRIEIRPWWYLQPDLQYIMHPGGSRAIPDALVIGLRSTLSF